MRVSDERPRIYLHIGRNKAGSTSLQDFFVAKRDLLTAAGLCYCLFGHLKDSVPGVPGFATQIELAEHARSANVERAYLISNEFMFGWPRSYTDAMAAGLADFDVRVIAYIRPYGDWLCSAYAEAVKRGETRQNFDDYFEAMRSRISAWDCLNGWGEVFGWDQVRIRSLHPRDLEGGGLIGDCLTALGLDPALAAGARRRNIAPHWAMLEMSRALNDTDSETGWSAPLWRIVEPLQSLMEDCLARRPVPPAAYLKADQERWLTDLYNSDVVRIAERSGTMLQPYTLSGGGRSMQPAFDRIPSALLRDWAARAATPEFRAAHPEAAEAAKRLAAGHKSGFERIRRLFAAFA